MDSNSGSNFLTKPLHLAINLSVEEVHLALMQMLLKHTSRLPFIFKG